jgi:hypothetical protein
MAKESKRKVKSKSSPLKYVSNDDELDSSVGEDEDEEALLNSTSKNPKARIKGLLGEIGIRDELLDQQEKLFVQEKESNQELKKLLKLEKEKNEKLDQELAQRNGTYKRLIKILKCNLMLFDQAPPSIQITMKLQQVK